MSDGKILWQAHVNHPVLTWPVVAKLDGDTSHTVFAFPSAGAHKNCRVWDHFENDIYSANWDALKSRLRQSCATALFLTLGWSCVRRDCKRPPIFRTIAILGIVVVVVCAFQLYSFQQDVQSIMEWWKMGDQPSEIVALDAETGAFKWSHVLARWKSPTALGDQEGFKQKSATQPWRKMCCPVAYSSPGVDGNGVVYIGHMSGIAFGVKDWDNNGVISDDEVYKFYAEGAFLHSGPAFAPGIFAFTTCDQLFVWRF